MYASLRGYNFLKRQNSQKWRLRTNQSRDISWCHLWIKQWHFHSCSKSFSHKIMTRLVLRAKGRQKDPLKIFMYSGLLAQNRKLAENVGGSWWTLIENAAQYIHFFTVSNFEHGINGNQSKRFPSIKEMRKTMKGADYCQSVLQKNWCLKKFQGWETTLQCNDVDHKFRRDRKNCTSDAFSCSP